MKRTILKFIVVAAAFGLGVAGAATGGTVSAPDAAIVKKLTHEIRMYPRYSIFDNVSFFVDEGRVNCLAKSASPLRRPIWAASRSMCRASPA